MKYNNIIYIYCLLVFINICLAQKNKYDITINLSDSGFAKKSGIIKINILGNNNFNETIVLSKSEEMIRPGDHKIYTFEIENIIENINRIQLKWTTQSLYIIAPKISVSTIDLYPSYLENNKYKVSFCASNKNQELVAKKYYPFWIKC